MAYGPFSGPRRSATQAATRLRSRQRTARARRTARAFTLTVVSNQPPVIELAATLTLLEERPFELPFAAYDPDQSTPVMLSQSNNLPGQPDLLQDNQNNSGVLRYTPPAGSAGSYELLVTATSADGGATTVPVAIVIRTAPPSTEGLLLITEEPDPVTVNLTRIADGDWIQWGHRSDGVPVRKAFGAGELGDYLVAGTSAPTRFNGTKASYRWTDGSPDATATGSRAAVRQKVPGNGFLLPLPADDTTRRLALWLGIARASGELNVALDDNSAPPQALLIDQPSGKTTRLVIIEYRAGSANQQLSVTWRQTAGAEGWISLEAGALLAPPNAPPVIAPVAPVTLPIGSDWQQTVSASDADGPAPLMLAQTNNLPGSPALLSDQGNGNALLSWAVPLTAPPGNYEIALTATDGSGNAATRIVSVAVAPNSEPDIANIEDVVTSAGSVLSLPVSASDSDGPGPLNLGLTLNPAATGATFTDLGNGQGLLQWSPTSADVSSTAYRATLTATDAAGASSAAQFDLLVLPNQPPAIPTLSDRSVVEGRTLRVPLQVTDTDSPGAFSVSASGTLPAVADLVFQDADGNWFIEWTATAYAAGAPPFDVTISAGDADGNTATHSFTVTVLSAQDGIAPDTGHPFFWNLRGTPTVLIGGSDDDSIFHWDLASLRAHLDLLVSVGGNYLRVAQNWRTFDTNRGDYVYDQRPQPWAQGAGGRYNLFRFEPAYWEALQRLLHETAQRGIVVQLELWDAFAIIGSPAWPTSGWNPLNNSSYSRSDTLINWRSNVNFADRNFFEAVPALNNDPILLFHQQRFVDKVLETAGPYNHVLYQIDNESYLPAAVSQYWADYLRNNAQGTVFVADSRRYHAPSFIQSNFQDITQAENAVPINQFQSFTYLDLAQNGGNSGQTHYDNLIWYREQAAQVAPRPINHVKTYAFDWPTGAGFGSRVAVDALEVGNKFWRALFGGAASVRFHRRVALTPAPGLGLGSQAQAHLQSAALLSARLGLHELVPDNSPLSGRESDEAYLLRDAGAGAHAVFFSGRGDGTVAVDLSGSHRLEWLDIANAAWLPAVSSNASPFTLTAPGPGHWVVVITPES